MIPFPQNLDKPPHEDWIKPRYKDSPDDDITKGLSPDFGSKRKRRNQLVRSLKRRRRYANPVRGGTGKQKRTRRNKFN